VGNNQGTVVNSRFAGHEVSGGSNVGGIAGQNTGTVRTSSSAGNITALPIGLSRAGGVVGRLLIV